MFGKNLDPICGPGSIQVISSDETCIGHYDVETKEQSKLECGLMPNVIAALWNIANEE